MRKKIDEEIENAIGDTFLSFIDLILAYIRSTIKGFKVLAISGLWGWVIIAIWIGLIGITRSGYGGLYNKIMIAIWFPAMSILWRRKKK
jgi:hypothetical protein